MTLFSTTPAAAFLSRFFPPLLLTEFLAMVLIFIFFNYLKKTQLKHLPTETKNERKKNRNRKIKLVSEETKMPRILGKSSKVGNKQEEDESGNWACMCWEIQLCLQILRKKILFIISTNIKL